MTTDSINEFKAEDSFIIEGRGTVFTGPNPFKFERDQGFRLFAERNPWTINGKLYEVIGVESFAIPIIGEGRPIGLLVKAWEPT